MGATGKLEEAIQDRPEKATTASRVRMGCGGSPYGVRRRP